MFFEIRNDDSGILFILLDDLLVELLRCLIIFDFALDVQGHYLIDIIAKGDLF